MAGQNSANAPLHSGLTFNPYIHGARGLFALMVFLYHVVHSNLPTFAVIEQSYLNIYLLNSFKFGVELFFGISGYVIIGALARAHSLRSFLWDRVTRIYPLLWATLISITVVSLLTSRWLPSPGEWALNFLAPPPFGDLYQVNPAAWSLGYEISFYFLCGVGWWLREKGMRLGLLATIVAGAVLVVLFPRALLMPAGIIIAAGAFGLQRSWLTRHPTVMLVLFLIIWRHLDLQFGEDIRMLNPLSVPMFDWLFWAPAMLLAYIMGALSLTGIAAGRGLISVVLVTRIMQWLGTISYSFYLWSPVVMGFIKYLMVKFGLVPKLDIYNQLFFALASLPITLIVSDISQRIIEKRLTKYLRKWGPAEGEKRAPLTAAA